MMHPADIVGVSEPDGVINVNQEKSDPATQEGELPDRQEMPLNEDAFATQLAEEQQPFPPRRW
jgi:hypothetical protein